MFKRYLAGLLVLLLVLGFVPTSVYASEIVAEGTCSDNLTWVLTDDGTLVVSGSGIMDNFSTSNPAPWDDYRSLIFTVIIEPGVETIGGDAFSQCGNLTSVCIPEGVTSIGSCAFALCTALNSVTLPDSITEIGGAAFWDCPLDNVIVPSGMTTIGEGAFRFCGHMTSVNIPVSVTTIVRLAFSNCNIQDIYYEGTEEQWAAVSIGILNATLNTAEVHFNSARTEIGPVLDVISGTCGDTIAWSLDKTTGILEISGTGVLNEVRHMYTNKVVYSPWYGMGELTNSLIIGEGITRIGEFAFADCGMTQVTLPTSVVMIDVNAFDDCTNLRDVYYAGTEEQWNSISISREDNDGNANLANANIHFAGSFDSVDGTTIVVDGVSGLSAGPLSGNDRKILDQAVSSSGLEKYVAFDITADITNETASVSIPVPGGWDTKRLVGVSIEDGVLKQIEGSYKDGIYTFDVDHFSAKGVAQLPKGPVEYIDEFSDVPVDSYYAAPVLWALENGITTGATETTFNPGGTCLRAQVVTFLHRAEGSPAPTAGKNPFSDVKSTDFFYKPVLWAVKEGITNGTSGTTFGSYDDCNRAAVVTFLWRAAGSPEPESTACPFFDVKPTDFYYKAVLWAVEKGITTGVDATHFGPTQACNRAQVVTFLYRAMT